MRVKKFDNPPKSMLGFIHANPGIKAHAIWLRYSTCDKDSRRSHDQVDFELNRLIKAKKIIPWRGGYAPYLPRYFNRGLADAQCKPRYMNVLSFDCKNLGAK